jgi:hypothetical protein
MRLVYSMVWVTISGSSPQASMPKSPEPEAMTGAPIADARSTTPDPAS